MPRRSGALALSLLPLARALTFSGSPAADLQPLFALAPPYLGADIATSFNVPSLGPSFFLWLHGDTLTGALSRGVRAVTGMPRNSVGVLNASAGAAAPAGEAHFIRAGAGAALHAGFWEPPDARQWYWPTGGLALDGRAFVLAMRMEDGPPGLFPFQMAGFDVLDLGAPASADPRAWPPPAATTLPHVNATLSLGNAVAAAGDGFVYLLGGAGRAALMARVGEADFAAAAWGALRFWTRGAWAPWEAGAPDAIFDDVPSEATLVRHGAGFWYILTANTFLSHSVTVRTAPRPEGPWSAPADAFRIPDGQLAGGAFCYAAKAHPELTPPAAAAREFVFSYMCNTPTVEGLLNRSDVYVPQLVRVAVGP